MELYDKMISHRNKGMQKAGNFFKEQEVSVEMLANNFDQMLYEFEKDTGVKLLLGPKYELKTLCEKWLESSISFESPRFETIQTIETIRIEMDNSSDGTVHPPVRISQRLMDDVDLIDQQIKEKYDQLRGAPGGREFVVNDIRLDFIETCQMNNLDDYQKRSRHTAKYLFNILRQYYPNQAPSLSVNMLCLKFIEAYPEFSDESTTRYETIKRRILDKYKKERRFKRNREELATLRKEIKSLKDLKSERVKERAQLRRQFYQNLKSGPHSTPDQSNVILSNE